MKNLRIIIISLMTTFLSGCIGAEIKETTTLLKDTDVVFNVGIGGSIYTSDKKKNLPNLFGKADIFGRKTPSGKTEVIFAGIQDGHIILIRNSITIETGATTMNSTPIVKSNTTTSSYAGNVDGYNYSGRSTTQNAPTVIMPNTPAAQFFNEGSIPIFISLQDLPLSIIVEDSNVEIISATKYKLQAKITK
tara:strand:- start:149 stop:721 length:573 start_codon:yes stop_codon:yes gene_type:complete